MSHLRTFIFLPLLAILAVCLPFIRSGMIAEAATGASEGQCQKTYQTCVQNNYGNCEAQWRRCIDSKCLPIDAKSLGGGIKQCSDDPDCLSSCTQFGTSKSGIISCCLGGPEHNNPCPHKVDSKCVNADEAPSIMGDEGVPEGNKIPGPNTTDPFSSKSIETELIPPEGLPEPMQRLQNDLNGALEKMPTNNITPQTFLEMPSVNDQITAFEKISFSPDSGSGLVNGFSSINGGSINNLFSSLDQPSPFTGPNGQSSFSYPDNTFGGGSDQPTTNSCPIKFFFWCI